MVEVLDFTFFVRILNMDGFVEPTVINNIHSINLKYKPPFPS